MAMNGIRSKTLAPMFASNPPSALCQYFITYGKILQIFRPTTCLSSRRSELSLLIDVTGIDSLVLESLSSDMMPRRERSVSMLHSECLEWCARRDLNPGQEVGNLL